MTFLDVFNDEDTLSVHQDFVQSSTLFLGFMEKSKSSIDLVFKSSNTGFIGNKNIQVKTSKLESRNIGDEKLLSAQIWYFIEKAINTNFQRACSEEKGKNNHKFVDVKEALFFKAKESINENLPLK